MAKLIESQIKFLDWVETNVSDSTMLGVPDLNPLWRRQVEIGIQHKCYFKGGDAAETFNKLLLYFKDSYIKKTPYILNGNL